MNAELDVDQTDFHGAMVEFDPILARWVLAKLKAGRDPRDIALLLQYHADNARGWCTGRFFR